MDTYKAGMIRRMDDWPNLATPGLPGPTDRSYWVVEGRLLAGAYPGKKMSGETGGRPEVTQQLLDAGVDMFVNLTEDLPGGGDRLSRYDSHVAGRADIVRLSIRDLGLPTVDHMVDILDTVDEHLADGRVVYVHCWGGFGRTGMVVGCWLRRHGYATAESVQDVVDRLRLGAVEGQHRSSPEMPDQRQLIVDWHEGAVDVDGSLEYGNEVEWVDDVPVAPVMVMADVADREQRVGQADRIVGAVLGSAAGDALGAGYEFTDPGLDTPIYMKGGGIFGWAPGEWTDDTQMAVAVLDAAAGGELDMEGVAANFLAWFDSMPTDVGNQTASVLSSATGQTDLGACAAAYLDTHPGGAGNGGLMRNTPVALTALGDRDLVAERAKAVASLTHAHPNSVAACVIWSLAIEEAVTSSDPDEQFDWEAAVRRGLEYLPEDRCKRWTEIIDEAVEGPPGRFNPNGWVVTAFQAALAAIIHTPVPEDNSQGHLSAALVAAVRIGHDTDTVAAIAGGLLGARWGASAVPDEWWQLIHGSRQNGSPMVGVAELEDLAVRAGGHSG